MADIDVLLEQLSNDSIKEKLQRYFSELKRDKRFGLIFEDHTPENIALTNVVPKEGDLVRYRNPKISDSLWRVINVSSTKLTIENLKGKESQTVGSKDVMVVKQFGEPVYTTLNSIGKIEKTKEKPFHSVINGENFHALQLLLFQFQGQVDCIYIDPPYNTGARDWKYNNSYVDENDSWKHSKWLSFMDKRLKLAKKLLSSSGVLIVTIDQNEVHHLGVLLDQLFPEYEKTMITIVIHGRGNAGSNFDRVEEYAFFLVPKGKTAINKRTLESYNSLNVNTNLIEDTRTFVRTGNNSTPARRPGMDYPIWVNAKTGKIRIGEVKKPSEKRISKEVNGEIPVWPYDERGIERVWRRNPAGAKKALAQGNLTSFYDKKKCRWRIRVTNLKVDSINHRTVWVDPSHAAKNHGTSLLTNFLGEERFSFPKSLYAVRDCLAAVTANKPNALILDFFAGSGTTLHATCLLNSQDGGKRRCILVTNNEVPDKLASNLYKQGIYPGDKEFEEKGIFNLVTRPRCEAVITGKRPDGAPVEGAYNTESGKAHLFSQGFEENVEFFNLEYLDPNAIGLGRTFKSILPALWVASGGVGQRELPSKDDSYSIPPDSTYAVLFKESHYKIFREKLKKRSDITHIWIITDSEEAFAEMRSDLSRSGLLTNRRLAMLYRDYLTNFEINTSKSL